MMLHGMCEKGSSLAVVLMLAAILVSCRPPRHEHDEGYRTGKVRNATPMRTRAPLRSETRARLVVRSPAFEPGESIRRSSHVTARVHRRRWSGVAPRMGREAMPSTSGTSPDRATSSRTGLFTIFRQTSPRFPEMRRTSAWMGSTTRAGPGTTPCAPGGRAPRRITSPSTPCLPSWGRRAAAEPSRVPRGDQGHRARPGNLDVHLHTAGTTMSDFGCSSSKVLFRPNPLIHVPVPRNPSHRLTLHRDLRFANQMITV